VAAVWPLTENVATGLFAAGDRALSAPHGPLRASGADTFDNRGLCCDRYRRSGDDRRRSRNRPRPPPPKRSPVTTGSRPSP
jgi:hypothetical protein